jgi:hypothetical protein
VADKNYYGAKSKIGASAYKKTAGPHGFEVKKATKARDEADAEVKRETKGASGTESLDAKREREAYDEFRRESRDLEYPSRADMILMGATPSDYKKGGKVSSASKRADGIAIRGKTRA